MLKKAAHKSSKSASRTRVTKSSRNDSFINWTHSHPLYFLIAIALSLVVLIMIHKLVSIRNEVDQIEEISSQQMMNDEHPMPKINISPLKTPGMMKGY